jgi:hypothetical protein
VVKSKVLPGFTLKVYIPGNLLRSWLFSLVQRRLVLGRMIGPPVFPLPLLMHGRQAGFSVQQRTEPSRMNRQQIYGMIPPPRLVPPSQGTLGPPREAAEALLATVIAPPGEPMLFPQARFARVRKHASLSLATPSRLVQFDGSLGPPCL